MKRAFLYLAIAVLLGTAVWKAFSLSKMSDYDDDTFEQANIFYDDFDADAISKLLIGLKVDSSETIENYKKERFSIGEIASSYDVIARFSATGCRPCIDTLMDRVMKLHSKKKHYKIEVIIGNMPHRDLYVNSQQYKNEISFFKADSLSFDLADHVESPYVFQLDKDGKILNHFVCRYGDTEELDKYMETI